MMGFRIVATMHLVQFISLFLIAICVQKSVQDCRVLADCNGGQAQWQQLTRPARGVPGKRGVVGPQGQKGEPGAGVNITELKQHLKSGSRGAQRFFYTSTITWESGKSFCHQLNHTLCTLDQICPPNNGGRKLVGDVIHGDHWVPVLDSHNDWVDIGTHHKGTCTLHRPPLHYGKPTWGSSTKPGYWKGYVYCCEPSANTESSAPDIRFQYIGKATTYASSHEHCETQGRRLCYSSEVCSASKPRLGTVKGSNWIAVKDRHNEWIQIGLSGLFMMHNHYNYNNNNCLLGPICGVHGIQHGLPAWGVRDDGTLRDDVGFVYCCKLTG